MSIKNGFNSKKVTFVKQDRLGDKIDKLISMTSKLTAQNDNQINSLNPKNIKANGEHKQEFFYEKNTYDERTY